MKTQQLYGLKKGEKEQVVHINRVRPLLEEEHREH